MTAWRIRVRHGARLVTLTYGPAGRISREDDTLRRCRCVCFPRHDARVGPGLLQVPHVTAPPFPTSVNFTVAAGSLSPDLRWDSAVEELSGWPVAPVCPCSLPLSRSHFPLKDRVSLLVPPLGPPRKELGGVTYCHNLNKLCPSRPRWHRMAHGWGASSRPRAEALDSHRTSITTVPLGVKCDPASNLERKHLLLQGAG